MFRIITTENFRQQMLPSSTRGNSRISLSLCSSKRSGHFVKPAAFSLVSEALPPPSSTIIFGDDDLVTCIDLKIKTASWKRWADGPFSNGTLWIHSRRVRQPISSRLQFFLNRPIQAGRFFPLRFKTPPQSTQLLVRRQPHPFLPAPETPVSVSMSYREL